MQTVGSFWCYSHRYLRIKLQAGSTFEERGSIYSLGKLFAFEALVRRDDIAVPILKLLFERTNDMCTHLRLIDSPFTLKCKELYGEHVTCTCFPSFW